MARAVGIVDKIITDGAQNAITTNSNGTTIISVERLLNGPSPQDVLFHILQAHSFAPTQSAQVFRAIRSDVTGRIFSSSTHNLLVNRGTIVIKPIDDAPTIRTIRIPEDGLYVYDDTTKVKIETLPCPPTDRTSLLDKNCCYADAAKTEWPLTIRTVRTGDRFVPFGMKGSRLVSDFLTDLKLNLFEKQDQTVLCDNKGRILWVTGLRTDNRFRISKETTTTIKATIIRN